MMDSVEATSSILQTININGNAGTINIFKNTAGTAFLNKMKSKKVEGSKRKSYTR
jgi:hypothetical protein